MDNLAIVTIPHDTRRMMRPRRLLCVSFDVEVREYVTDLLYV